MPKRAIALRSRQKEDLASLLHKQRTGRPFRTALEALIDLESGVVKDASLSPPQIAALREWRRDFLRHTKLPPSFIRAFARTTTDATHAWEAARRRSDFASFLPHLERVVSLCRRQADLLGFREHPYDALLDLYEPETTCAQLTPLLARLAPALTHLVQRIRDRPQIPDDFLHRDFPVGKQIHFTHLLLEAMGFDGSSSRLDHSAHPFCVGLHPHDTRMTTRIDPTFPMMNIFSVLHEGGHGLYNMGLPENLFGTPLCESLSLGIDESQSRWWECLIGRSLPFWEHFFPQLVHHFPDALADIRLEEFYRAINRVQPSLIRTDSDELTYNLHILLRFELEKGLIEGSIQPREIPSLWNDKMRQSLGVAPTHDAEGCLQDIHWSHGSIGYFPTYTLGNLYAAQLFATCTQAYPQWKQRVAKGELGFLREWLHDKVHRHGRQYPPRELIQQCTGTPLNEQPFLTYLESKYSALYSL